MKEADLLKKVLYTIQYKSKSLTEDESKELDNEIILLIDSFGLFNFNYPKGYSGHIDFEKVFHNAEIHKLYKYLFKTNKYDILKKYIDTGEDILKFFSTFYPNFYIEWETRDLDLKWKLGFLNFVEFKLENHNFDFIEVGKFLSKFVHNKTLKEKYPNIFNISKGVKKKNELLVNSEKNTKSKVESIKLVNNYLNELIGYRNKDGGELYCSANFSNIKNNKYSNYHLNINEENFTILDKNGKNTDSGWITKVDMWESELNNKLNQWLFSEKIGDLNDSIISKVLYELSNIIPEDNVCYELDYDDSKGYVWCDGFEFLWVGKNNMYSIRLSLDD